MDGNVGLSNETQHLNNYWLECQEIWTLMVPRGRSLLTLIPWFFSSSTTKWLGLLLCVKCLDNYWIDCHDLWNRHSWYWEHESTVVIPLFFPPLVPPACRNWNVSSKNISTCTAWIGTHFETDNLGPQMRISSDFGHPLTFSSMKFATDIHGFQRMNHDDFGEPLAFHPAPPSGQNVPVSNDQIPASN